jgi:hypothetical protein
LKIITDKLGAARLVMGLLQRCHAEWLALDRWMHTKTMVNAIIVQSDKLLSAFLELEAMLL